MNSIRDRKPININKSFHSDYINLKISSESEISDSPFTDFREIYILSAVIGVKNEAFEELKVTREKAFDSNVFNKSKDLPVLYAIAFAKERNAELLANDDYVLKIVEGYANGGFPILLSAIRSNESNNLFNLALFVDDLLPIS